MDAKTLTKRNAARTEARRRARLVKDIEWNKENCRQLFGSWETGSLTLLVSGLTNLLAESGAAEHES